MRLNALTVLALTLTLLARPAAWSDEASVSGSNAPYIYILGVAQDAGYPQALCFEPHCRAGWEDATKRRTAVSLAVISPQEKATLLFEAPPQIPDQLYRLNLEAPLKSFPIKGIFLTHAHMGHYTGLMHFGFEAASTKGLPVFAMPRMKSFLETNGPWSQLVDFENIKLMPLHQDKPVQPVPEIKVTPFHVPHREEYSEAVGYRIEGPNQTALFIPDIDKWQKWDRDIAEEIKRVDYALIDATFFNGDELPGRDMANIPHPSVEESMSLLKSLSSEERSRVYFIHFNHTNPLLNTVSAEAETVRQRGFNVSTEGLRLPL